MNYLFVGLQDWYRNPAPKMKFWVHNCKLVFERQIENIEEKVTLDAKDTSIGVFPDVSSPLPNSFQFASMDTKMSLLIKNQISALFLRSDNSMSLTSVTWSGGITFLAL